MTPRTPRLLVWLLRAFPPGFRAAYGADMAATFADRRAAARRHGRRAVAALWVRTVASVLVHGLAERRRSSFRQAGGSHVSVPRLIQWAGRRLSRSRGFTLAVFLTLMVGLACATTVFSIVNAVLFRPLPYPQSERLVSVSHTLQVHGSLRVESTSPTRVSSSFSVTTGSSPRSVATRLARQHSAPRAVQTQRASLPVA